jgi:hypothetical protein
MRLAKEKIRISNPGILLLRIELALGKSMALTDPHPDIDSSPPGIIYDDDEAARGIIEHIDNYYDGKTEAFHIRTFVIDDPLHLGLVRTILDYLVDTTEITAPTLEQLDQSTCAITMKAQRKAGSISLIGYIGDYPNEDGIVEYRVHTVTMSG